MVERGCGCGSSGGIGGRGGCRWLVMVVALVEVAEFRPVSNLAEVFSFVW